MWVRSCRSTVFLAYAGKMLHLDTQAELVDSQSLTGLLEVRAHTFGAVVEELVPNDTSTSCGRDEE